MTLQTTRYSMGFSLAAALALLGPAPATAQDDWTEWAAADELGWVEGDADAPVTVIEYFSPTCSHCKERTPVLVDLLKEWQDKGVEVYALFLDPEVDKWKAFVEQFHMEGFHNVIDPDYESRYYKKYHIDITPEAYVIDKHNVIIAKDLHPNQLPDIFRKELNQ